VDFAATGRVIPMDEDDAWLLDQSELTLARGSGKTRLTRKTADVLACLIRNSGRVVAQDVLLREVWPGITVKVDLVREYVCDLRALLGDDAETPRLIETVRGLGYRLVGNVRLSDRRSWIEPRLVTVAVVGLAGPAQDRRGQCMALGLAEDIRSELSRSPEIAVFADEPSPADRWQQAESRPVAQYMITVSTRANGRRLDVLVNLIRSQTARIVWSRHFRVPSGRATGVAEQVACAVANSLGGIHGEISRLEANRLRSKPEAELNPYDHYVLANDAVWKFEKASAVTGLGHIEKALAGDPGFARSWYILYWLCHTLSLHCAGREQRLWRERSSKALETAVERDPGDPMILDGLACVQANEGRVEAAVTTTERAIDFGSGQADACALLSCPAVLICGRPERGVALIDRALALHPTPPSWYAAQECKAAFYAGDHRRALGASERAPPSRPALAYRTLAAASLGNEELAQRCWHELRSAHPRFSFEGYAEDLSLVHPEAIARFESGVRSVRRMIGPRDS
jgi:DNA-binding winged helix-turn-helix (wHTH) protein